MSIIINEVEKNDENAKLIMEWRNDEHTRMMSYNSDVKVWDNFSEVFEDKYFDNYVPPLFACYDNEKIAFIGCVGNNAVDSETDEQTCKIGINMSPKFRGRRLGQIIVTKSIDYINSNFPTTKRIVAEMKPENTPSVRLFQSCGFKFVRAKKWNDLNMLVYHFDIERILVLAAHPDDETLGCGGTISRLSKSPNTYIKLITFTDGESSRDASDGYDRNCVLDNVCDYLGINEYVVGNFPDNKMDSVPLLDVAKFVEENVNFTPSIIFTHHRNCNNVDHAIVYKATVTAFRPWRHHPGERMKILSYFVPSSTDYNPFNDFRGNVYYDIEDTIQTKLECLRKNYASEMRDYPHTRSYENIENLAKVWGCEVGLKCAERFELVREIN